MEKSYIGSHESSKKLGMKNCFDALVSFAEVSQPLPKLQGEKNLDVLSTPPSVQSRKRCLTKQEDVTVCSKKVKEQPTTNGVVPPTTSTVTPSMVPEVGKKGKDVDVVAFFPQ